jgi:hypothetical protein
MEKETELAAVVVAWLIEQNWTVYQEVQFQNRGGVADIVAVRNGIVWIIECKTRYCFDVLLQASEWPVHYRSVAVPWARDGRDYRVAKDYYQVGVLEVNRDHVQEVIRPKAFIKNHQTVKKYLAQLTELHKTFALAGSKGGQHLTPYKQTMMDVRRFIEKHPGCTAKDLFDEYGEMHYSSPASFKGNIVKALADFEPWCRVDYSTKPCRLFIKEQEPA